MLSKFKGWRTVLLALGVALLGYLSTVDIVDVRSFVTLFVKDEHVVGAVMFVLGLLFTVMRFVTSTGVLSGSDSDE